MLSSDKHIELNRFESRAEKLLLDDNVNFLNGSESMPEYLRPPYIFFEKKIRNLIKKNDKVLEIGSGTGLHTDSLIKTGAYVTATDISQNSLHVLEHNLSKSKKSGGRLRTLVADMENLPFQDKSFDVVASAGSLSYGDSKIVDKEIRRVLKPTGFFICVDSLNNNPIYKFNRYLHYLQGTRSKMTLINMPSIKRLEKLTQLYSEVEVGFWGSISYLMPFIKIITGAENAKKISDFVDKLFCVRKSAFKFVLVAQI